MNYVLCIILAVLCGISGILVIGWIGYEFLWFFGHRGYSRRRLRLAGVLFALPGGALGAWVGYLVWTQLQFQA
jgi:hypothetical protein